MNASFKERKIAPDVLELLDAKNAKEVMDDLGEDIFIILYLNYLMTNIQVLSFLLCKCSP